jgi:hypothetical protein
MRQARFGAGKVKEGSATMLMRGRRSNTRRQSAMTRLRSEYFASAADVAARYGVTFDRLIAHLWHARSFNAHFFLAGVTHLDDLVHAVACVDEVGLAWAELADRYERALVRRCRNGAAEIDATIAVRRMLADLRRHNTRWDAQRFPTLHGYAGVQPLRVWLGERALGSAAWTTAKRRTDELVAVGRDIE